MLLKGQDKYFNQLLESFMFLGCFGVLCTNIIIDNP